MRGWWSVFVVGVLGAVGATEGLRRLDYSTSWIVTGTVEAAAEAPGAEFRLGRVVWPLALYASAPQLEPYRTAFDACRALKGLSAAGCIYSTLDQKSPIGNPITEFVDASYDPAFALGEHLKGAAGHCTTRSALTATALLAFGVPARVVQLLPDHGNGHNLVEVHEPAKGWVIFDPSAGDWLADERGLPVTTASLQGGGEVRWARLAKGPNVSVYRFATVLYPEPWLYTRVGERAAKWPFRGTFVRVGDRRLDVGPLQKGTLAVVLLGVALAGFALLRIVAALRRPTPTPSARPTSGAPTGVPDPETPASVL